MMIKTGIYDLQNIIAIGVKMRGVRHLTALRHMTSHMGRFSEINFVARIPHAVPQYNYVEYDRWSSKIMARISRKFTLFIFNRS
jgi:hypothetical protein